jgi:hypothetical protein
VLAATRHRAAAEHAIKHARVCDVPLSWLNINLCVCVCVCVRARACALACMWRAA